MLLLKILVSLLIIWIVLRTVVTYRVFIIFLSPDDRTWTNFYHHYFVRKLPDFFSFQDLKKDLGVLDVAKKLSHEDFNMDDLFPTDDQLQWLQARIFELFKHEYMVSGEYVPLNIQPLWALIAIMVPKESELYNRVPIMDETQLVNTSMIYLRARDKATAELNAIAKKDWEGYYFDQPMAFWAFRQVHINTDKLNRDIEYRPLYVIDTTRND